MKPLNKTGRGGQFSQLTLEGFGPRDIQPTAEHRWPEGFSPERRDAVAGRLNIRQVEGGDSSQHALHPWVDTRGGENDGPNLGQKRVIAAVARSSAPVEHLQSPRFMQTQNWSGEQLVSMFHERNPRMKVNVGGHLPGAAGWFEPRSGEVNVADSTRKRPESEQQDVLLHEIGHAVSHSMNTPHSTRAEEYHELTTGTEHPMSDSVRHGREEAFADNYAVQHRGGRRGEELPGFTSGYERPGVIGATYGLTSTGTKQADAEYNAARLPSAGTSKVQAKGSSQFFETPLFGRSADQINTDTEQDFGQFGWFNNSRSGARLDSIRVGSGPPARAERMKPGFTPQDVDLMANHTEQMMARQWSEHVNIANDPTVSKKQRKASRLEASTRLGIGRSRKRQGYGNA